MFSELLSNPGCISKVPVVALAVDVFVAAVLFLLLVVVVIPLQAKRVEDVLTSGSSSSQIVLADRNEYFYSTSQHGMYRQSPVKNQLVKPPSR